MNYRVPKQREQTILSTSTILILSGFLIGLSVGKMVAEDLSPYVLVCGLSGFLAFIALDEVAARRRDEQWQEEQQQREDRLDKHVHSLSSFSFTLPPPAVEDEDVFAEFREVDTAEARVPEQLST